MSTLKDCVVCYKEFEGEGVSCDETQKLTEICCKYLHSSITEMSSNHSIRDKSSFCKECFKFFEKLYNLDEEMGLYLKQISTLVFEGQSEILQRRSGRTSNNSDVENGPNYIKSWRQLIECQSTIPNNDFRKTYSDIPDANENVTSEEDFSNLNIPTYTYNEVFQDQLVIPSSDIVGDTVHVTFEQIKVERDEIDLIDEMNNTGDIDADLFPETEILISGVSTVNTDHKKLNYCGNTISITEKRDNIGAGQIVIQTDVSGKDSGSSLKIADGIETSSHEGFKRRLHGCTSTKTSGSLSNQQISEERICNSSSTSHGGKLPSDLIESHSKIDECQVKEKEQQELQKILQQTHSKQNNSKKCLPDESKKVCLKVVLQPKVGHKDNEKMSVNHSGKGFSEQNGLINHKRVHSEKRLYKCEICKKGFKEKHNLKRHRIVHSGEKPYGCEFCVKRFAAKTDLNEHFRVHTREKPFKCVTCGMEFAQKSSFRRHVRIHSGEKPSSTSLIRNMSIHLIESDNKKVDCNVKDKEQQELRNVLPQNHSKQNNSKKYQPDESEKVWRKVSQPKIGQTDKGEMNVNRAITGKGFSQQSGLINLGRAHSEERLDKIVVSGKAFGEKSSLKSYREDRNVEKPYKCTICAKRFDEKWNLNRHFRIHSGEKPYYCTLCEKRFSENCGLLRHRKIHSEERPYKCNVCEKTFKEKHRLKIHERVHTGEKPYHCGFCRRRFSQKSSLNRHIRVHTGEKPYVCTLCKKRFSDSSGLIRHRKTHSKERPYKCKFCGNGFKESSSLSKHKKRFHFGEKSQV